MSEVSFVAFHNVGLSLIATRECASIDVTPSPPIDTPDVTNPLHTPTIEHNPPKQTDEKTPSIELISLTIPEINENIEPDPTTATAPVHMDTPRMSDEPPVSTPVGVADTLSGAPLATLYDKSHTHCCIIS